MSEVDDRIVSIQFDNASFERRIESTLTGLDKLSESLRFAGAEKGFQNISSAANGFDLSGMAHNIDGIASKFGAMGAIGFSTIQHLTTSVLDFVSKTGSDILEPILTGGKSRAINLEQAKFLFQGIGIDVQKGMDSALAAVKGTAFGLDEAAKAAAQFGASGIKVGDQMTGALRGVAGVAALTGRSFSEIGDIFASSAATGVVNNQDLQQFATRGLNAAAALGKQMGITEQQVHEMASAGQLDFKTFAAAIDKAFGSHAQEANKTYTGSLANLHAAFSRLGASFIAPHLEQQRDLFNALTPVIDNVAGALLPLINDFVVLKRISTDNIIKFLNKLDIASFKTGVGNLAVGFVNLYKALKPIARAFKSAFQQVFSGSIGKTFVSLTESFKNFTAGIKIGVGTLTRIKGIFRGFFAALEIGFTIFKELVRTIGSVVQALLPAGEGFLHLGKTGGDFIVNLNKALVAGGGIKDFFEALTQAIIHPIAFIQTLKDRLVDFFSGISVASTGPLKFLEQLRDKIFSFFGIFSASGAAEAGLGRVGQRLQQLSDIWDRVQNTFTKVKDFLQPVLTYISNWFKELGHKIAEAFHPGDFNAALDVINVGLLGGIVLLLRNFLKNGLKLDIGKGVIQKIQNALDGLTNTLKSMQTNLKAQALEKIAIAIALLTASLVVLSLIDSAKLTKALIALSVSFGQLIGALTLLDKLNFSSSIVKLNGIAAAMILIAGAAIVLSIAVTILSKIKFGDLAKGLGGVAVGLGLLVASTRLISGDTAGLISASLAMIGIAIALNIMAGAVKLFSKMSFGDMAKGLLGVSVALAAVAIAMKAMPPSSVLSGAGFIEIAIGLNILAGAVKLFSLLKAGDIAKGLIGIGAALVIIAGAMHLMPLTLPITAAGVLILSIALGIMAGAVKLMASMDLGQLAKGIGAFAVMLAILVVAMNGLDTGIVGAAALVLIAGSMAILAHVLVTFSKLSFGDLLKGLLGIAGVLTVLGLAALALTPVLPELLALGLALAVIGGAFALFGVGAALVGKAFEIMAKSGAAGAKGMLEAIKIIATALPTIEKTIVDTAIGFVKDLLKAAPLLVRLIQALLDQLLDTVIELAPKIAKAVGVVITNILTIIKEDSPKFIEAGFTLLINFLKGIRDHIEEIVAVVSEIIVKFINALSDHVDDVADAVRHFIITVFVVAIEKLTNLDLIFAGLGSDVMKGLLHGLGTAAIAVFNFFKDLPGKIINIFKKLLGINSPSTVFQNIGVNLIAGFLLGILSKVGEVLIFFTTLPIKILFWVGDMARTLINKGADIIKGLYNGITKTIHIVTNWLGDLVGRIPRWVGDGLSALKNVGVNIITGLWNGIVEKTSWFVDKITGWISDHIPGVFKKILNIKSPSKVMESIGKNIVNGLSGGLFSFSPSRKMIEIGKTIPQGLIKGLSSMDSDVKASSFGLSQTVLDAFGEIHDVSPTVTPVLDLTKIKAQAKDMPEFMTDPSLTPDVSINQARLISKAIQPVTAEISPVGNSVPTTLNFEQNNYSPEALSTNDIYRNTKGQIALAKEKLGIS